MCCSACSMRLWPSCSRALEELLLSTEPQSAEHFPLLIYCQRFLWIYNEDLQSKILLYSTWPCSLFNRECLLAAPNKDVLHELWSQYALQVPLVTPLSKPLLWPYYTYTVYNTLLRLSNPFLSAAPSEHASKVVADDRCTGGASSRLVFAN